MFANTNEALAEIFSTLNDIDAGAAARQDEIYELDINIKDRIDKIDKNISDLITYIRAPMWRKIFQRRRLGKNVENTPIR